MTLRGKVMAASMVLPFAIATSSAAQENEFVITTIEMQLEAGSAFYEAWPSGMTIHSGVGYIRPYGRADYWCGVDYAEAEGFPPPQQDLAWLLEDAIDSNPLFCIYRMEEGDIYTYDILIGSIERAEEGIEKVDSVVNVVIGGTGDFADASGVWVGTTAGRGEGSEVAEGITLPASILKLMEGYMRLPAGAD